MKRRKLTSGFKTKIVLEVLKERSSLSELGQKYSVSPSQISKWKAEFLSGASSIFDKKKKGVKSDEELERDRLLKTIGELKVENDYLKKTLR